MTFHRRLAKTSSLPTLSLTCLLLLSTSAAAFAKTSRYASEYAARALPATLGETVRGEGLEADTPDCFRFETPEAGLLLLDVAVPGTAGAEPRLGVTGARGLKVIERSASHLLAASARPQELTVCVGAQDPRQRLGAFKLESAFQAYGFKAEPLEVDPDPFTACGNLAKAEPLEVDPDPFTACDSLVKALDALCLAGDDHADAFLCATPLALGRRAGGTLDNGWGDDHDLFAFELTAPRTVRIAAAADADTFGGLYDRDGQRLASAAGQDKAGFRMVKTLPAGLYFVRVEGREWTQGAYSLRVDTLARSW